MKEFAVERELLKKTRRNLIGSYFTEKILLVTPLLQWYLEKGLVVTKVFQVTEYTPSRCFERFAHEISDARWCGDENPDKEPFAKI